MTPAESRTGAIALTVGVILLAGCTAPAQTSGAAKSPSTGTDSTGQTPEDSTSPTPSPTEPGATLPADLSFEAGASLGVGDWQTGWKESFSGRSGFSVVALDTGTGFWAYSDDATQCQIQFMHVSGDATDAGLDDRTFSDELLVEAIVTPASGVTREDVLGNAYDDAIAQAPGPGTVAVRTIRATTVTGETWLRSARVFSALGGRALIGINCPSGQDANAEFAKLLENDLAISVKPLVGG